VPPAGSEGACARAGAHIHRLVHGCIIRAVEPRTGRPGRPKGSAATWAGERGPRERCDQAAAYAGLLLARYFDDDVPPDRQLLERARRALDEALVQHPVQHP
jgi:hypothetical protein